MAASDERLQDWERRLDVLRREMEGEYPPRPGFYDEPMATLTRYAKEAVENERQRLGPDSLRHLLDEPPETCRLCGTAKSDPHGPCSSCGKLDRPPAVSS